MFRFERKGTVKTAADVPAAVKFAAEVTAYLNKQHSLNISRYRTVRQSANSLVLRD